jgi:hypothetical protein
VGARSRGLAPRARRRRRRRRYNSELIGGAIIAVLAVIGVIYLMTLSSGPPGYLR